MFTPNKIFSALETLYDLVDPDVMVGALADYHDEFDSIAHDALASAFQRNADMVSEYRVLSSAGDGIDYYSKALLNNRAVRIMIDAEGFSGDDRVRTMQCKELWLEEDMTFSIVSCVSTILKEKDEPVALIEHRTFIKKVECEDDIFFDISDLICELDDICMFEILLDADATVCEL